jgi:two-component system sensor histidine kinase/response regulator
MCGAIGADANADGGSRFWFTARFGIAGPGAHTAPLADTSTLAGLRVLVAEDNDINLEILTELLAGMGITVRGARNGAEALDVIHTGWPQLVLMDMQMPVMDGLAATVALRQLPQGRGLPVIALTANALHEDRARCLAAGMNDHLAKPIDVAALQALLLRWRPKG